LWHIQRWHKWGVLRHQTSTPSKSTNGTDKAAAMQATNMTQESSLMLLVALLPSYSVSSGGKKQCQRTSCLS
jgi:hypothetical protein